MRESVKEEEDEEFSEEIPQEDFDQDDSKDNSKVQLQMSEIEISGSGKKDQFRDRLNAAAFAKKDGGHEVNKMMSRAVSEVQIIEETSAEGYQTNRAVEHTNKNDLPRKHSSRDLPQSDDEVLVSNPNKTGTNSYDIPKPASVNETPN